MRQWTFPAIGVTVAALVGATLFLLPRRPRFEEAYLDRIHEGMTEREVEAFLNLPEEDYRPKARRVHDSMSISVELVRDSGWFRQREFSTSAAGFDGGRARVRNWWVDNYLVSVAFDPKGRVIGHSLWEFIYPDTPVLWQKSEGGFGL
jgi:hypothetical protein